MRASQQPWESAATLESPHENITPWEYELKRLEDQHLYRIMPEVSGLPGRTICVNGTEALNFSGNNYLGLAGHPAVIAAYAEYARAHGAGSTASRLIAGNNHPHRELESYIAEWKGTEAALVFVSGYQANLGIISSVAEKGDLIISDQLNHASIVDGCRLSRATVAIYPHLDLDRLEELLRQQGFRRKLVVTESVFSMDGHRAPLKEISELCRRWDALLMVDEAHATGLFGPQGQGLAAEEGVVPDIQMGTLGKAVGTAGAYVAGSRSLTAFLVNRARSLIYTTAAPPPVAGSALAALQLLASHEGHERRARLRRNVSTFAQLVDSLSGGTSNSSHIVPIVVGESRRALAVSRACLRRGVFAQAIRYPTVPEGTARLRFTLMSDHEPEDLSKAVAVLEGALSETAADSHGSRGIPQQT